MKKFKRIAAGVLAAATMAATGVTAFAIKGNGTTDNWNINYISGAPSSVSNQICDCELYFFSRGYQSTCNNFDGYGDGYISVSVRGTERWKITGKGTVPRLGYEVDYSDAPDGMVVTFRFTAVGEHVIGSGTVHQY